MLDELKSIALELLDKYQKAEESCIWEYSFCIEEDVKVLKKECENYRERIEKACKS